MVKGRKVGKSWQCRKGNLGCDGLMKVKLPWECRQSQRGKPPLEFLGEPKGNALEFLGAQCGTLEIRSKSMKGTLEFLLIIKGGRLRNPGRSRGDPWDSKECPRGETLGNPGTSSGRPGKS